MRTAVRAAFLMAVAVAPSHASHGGAKKPTVDVVKGEVVDLQCYMADSKKRGPDHETCARECINAGNPVGILTSDGTLYVALGKDMKTANEVLAPFAARKVKVTGKKLRRAKMAAILVEKVEELQAEKPRPKTVTKSWFLQNGGTADGRNRR